MSGAPGPNFDRSNADLLDIADTKEPWSEFTLSDGARVRVKTVLLEAWKDRVAKDQAGNPVYHLSLSSIMSVIHPQPEPPTRAARRRQRRAGS